MAENTTQEREIPSISKKKLESRLQEMSSKQNLPLAILVGIISFLAGASIWVAITVTAEYQIGRMAIGVGFLVGGPVRFLGKGINNVFGYTGAIFSLLGCLLCNFLGILGYFEILGMVDYSKTLEFMAYTSQRWCKRFCVKSISTDAIHSYSLGIFSENSKVKRFNASSQFWIGIAHFLLMFSMAR